MPSDDICMLLILAQTANQVLVQYVNRWAELREVADKKKEGLQLAHDVNTYHIECQETAVSDCDDFASLFLNSPRFCHDMLLHYFRKYF